MSVDHLSRVLALGPEISGSERMVAVVLAEAANRETDECWPSIETIAARAGMRKRTSVSSAIARLVDAGIVAVAVNKAPDPRYRGDRKPNLYRLIGPLAVARPGEPVVFDLPAPKQAKPKKPKKTAPTLPGTTPLEAGPRSTGPRGTSNGVPSRGVAPRGVLTKTPSSNRKGTVTPPDGVRQAADRVTKEWWERRRDEGNPSAQPFIGVVKIVETALRNGVEIGRLTRALDACPTVTGPALEFQLSKQDGRTGRQAPALSPGAVEVLTNAYNGVGGDPRTGSGRDLPSKT